MDGITVTSVLEEMPPSSYRLSFRFKMRFFFVHFAEKTAQLSHVYILTDQPGQPGLETGLSNLQENNRTLNVNTELSYIKALHYSRRVVTVINKESMFFHDLSILKLDNNYHMKIWPFLYV
jgi:hypothetical protein